MVLSGWKIITLLSNINSENWFCKEYNLNKFINLQIEYILPICRYHTSLQLLAVEVSDSALSYAWQEEIDIPWM